MKEFVILWTCEHCGRAVDVASDDRIDHMSGSEIMARVNRVQAEHQAVCECPLGLDVRPMRLPEPSEST